MNTEDKLAERNLTRRDFLRGAAVASAGAAVAALAVGCPAPAATPTPAPTATPARAGRRLVKWPMNPIAANLEDAYKWGNEQEQKNAGRIEDLTLTAEEEAKVKAMGLVIGYDSGGLPSAALYGAIEARCKALGIEPVVVSRGGTVPAQTKSAKMLIQGGVDAVITSSPGTDFGYTEVVKLYYEAGIPTFSTSRPATSYYPTTCCISGNAYKSGAESARVLARKLAAEGYKEAQVAQISLPLGMASY